jgi:hypothetical protein
MTLFWFVSLFVPCEPRAQREGEIAQWQPER